MVVSVVCETPPAARAAPGGAGGVGGGVGGAPPGAGGGGGGFWVWEEAWSSRSRPGGGAHTPPSG